VLGIVGLLKTAPPMPMHFQNAGRAVMLLGGLGNGDETRFGGTQYAKVIIQSLWGLPPALDMDREKRVHEAMREIAGQQLAESAHDLSDGGFAVTLAECCFGAGGIGASVSLSFDGSREGAGRLALFHEAPSRILLSTKDPRAVEAVANIFRVECFEIGVTIEQRFQVRNRSELLIDCSLGELKQPWESSLEGLLNPT
jgi:phosphoribosylformylglycinamidine (FGAM) synthase-like enzyme